MKKCTLNFVSNVTDLNPRDNILIKNTYKISLVIFYLVALILSFMRQTVSEKKTYVVDAILFKSK